MYHSDNGLSTYGGRKHLGTLVLFVQLCNEPKISHWKKKESTKKKKQDTFPETSVTANCAGRLVTPQRNINNEKRSFVF